MSVNIKAKVNEREDYLNDVDWEALCKAVKMKNKFLLNKPKLEKWEDGELIDAILDESNILTDNVIRYYFGDESVISEDFHVKNEAIKQIECAFLDKIVKRYAENFNYPTFEKIASTIIAEDITWIKIVGIFAFYAKMASHCKEIGKKTIVASTSTYVGKFLTQNKKTIQFLKENGIKGNIYKNMKPVKKVEVNVEILKKKILGILMMGGAFIMNYV